MILTPAAAIEQRRVRRVMGAASQADGVKAGRISELWGRLSRVVDPGVDRRKIFTVHGHRASPCILSPSGLAEWDTNTDAERVDDVTGHADTFVRCDSPERRAFSNQSVSGKWRDGGERPSPIANCRAVPLPASNSVTAGRMTPSLTVALVQTHRLLRDGLVAKPRRVSNGLGRNFTAPRCGVMLHLGCEVMRDRR